MITLKLLFLTICILNFTSCTPTNIINTNTLNTEILNANKPNTNNNIIPTTSYEAKEYENAIDLQNEFLDKLTVTRALVSKMIALTYEDKNNIEILDSEISFDDVPQNSWYYKYINFVKIHNIMIGDEKLFSPTNPLTVNDAQLLIDKLDPSNIIKIKITDENKHKPISYALWSEIYFNLLQNISNDKTIFENFEITKKDMVVLATSKNNNNLKGFHIITDQGPLHSEGIDMTQFINKEVSLLLKGNEIICILKVTNNEPTIKNALILSNDDKNIKIFTGGIEKIYKSSIQIPNPKNKIADIKIKNDVVLDIKIFDEKLKKTIKKLDNKFIEFENNIIMPLSDNFKIYNISKGAVKWNSLSNLIVGTNVSNFIISEGTVKAAIIEDNFFIDKVRVSISTTNFASLYHDNVILQSTEEFSIFDGENTLNFKASQIVDISSIKDLDSNKRWIVTPSKNTAKIKINSIKRNWDNNESPLYRGTLEILKEENKFLIVNEIPIEEYLYAVVPSEMPSSYGLQTSKIQAIAARSYAYNQYYANRYHKYGANIDDSVSCQVYNNIPENEISIQAVSSTKGQCIVYNNSVISANFFSTSSGYTANSGDVWADYLTKKFPGNTSEYLSATQQYWGNDFGDLSLEENASQFFKNIDIQSFDSNFSWFRWNVSMSKQEIEASINNNLKSRYDSSKHLIKTLQKDGIYRSKPIETIGELVDISVLKRGQAGNILELKIVGSLATVLISTEYNIRNIIKPAKYIKSSNDIILNRKDNSKLTNYSIMPSAFYTFDKIFDNNNSLIKINFFGAGNGHGVGMSQNGAKTMVDMGYSIDDVLKHYFKNTSIKTMF